MGSASPKDAREEALVEAFAAAGGEALEARVYGRLVALFLALPEPPFRELHFPRYGLLLDALARSADLALRAGEVEPLHERLLELYAHLHMHEAPYSAEERARVDAAGGYWAHAGGLSPIVEALRLITPSWTSVDLGAGNGLQGLLMQRLAPHALTRQVEISARMVEIGRALAAWLEVPDERLDWRVADLARDPLPPLGELVYLYRPLRPEGVGLDFYRRLAAALARLEGPLVLLSVADALAPLLDEGWFEEKDDGHLLVMRRRPDPRV